MRTIRNSIIIIVIVINALHDVFPRLTPSYFCTEAQVTPCHAQTYDDDGPVKTAFMTKDAVYARKTQTF